MAASILQLSSSAQSVAWESRFGYCASLIVVVAAWSWVRGGRLCCDGENPLTAAGVVARMHANIVDRELMLIVSLKVWCSGSLFCCLQSLGYLMLNVLYLCFVLFFRSIDGSADNYYIILPIII